jgi:hypothetical protein
LVAEASHSLIINGTGFGGLRASATARPNRLFSATGAAGGAAIPDPTSNLTKINSYLTGARLAAISGSGGYLTIAPAGATYVFPVDGAWSDADIGLKVVDSNSTGADVSLAALTGWNKNLAVDAGATLDLGSNPFTFSGPRLHGKGTITTTGGITIANTAALSRAWVTSARSRSTEE